MGKRLKALAAVILALCAALIGCSSREVREEVKKTQLVRIYDVEPQDRSHVLQSNYENYAQMQVKLASAVGEERERLQEKLNAMDALEFTRHEFRMGIFTGVAEAQGPFAMASRTAGQSCEIEVEYVILDNWEALRQELAAYSDDGVTKIVLFNNTYDASLMKEVSTGGYADLEDEMEACGLYDSELYDQVVMSGGRVEGVQYLLPLLYNVAGMVHGESMSVYDGDTLTAPVSAEDYDPQSLSYEEFMYLLKSEMEQWDSDSLDVTFLSSAFRDGNVDLFLLASGMQWEEYRDQEELFAAMLDYLSTYQRTQVDTQSRGMSNQELYMLYLAANERRGMDDALSTGTLEALEIDVEGSMYRYESYFLLETLLERTKYFVECSTSEDIAFHSILGTLNYSHQYCVNQTDVTANEEQEWGIMEYYPIGIEGSENEFAAQLISYAAVVDGGDTELAVQVLKEMLSYEYDGVYGLSPCIEVREKQLTDWVEQFPSYRLGQVRNMSAGTDGYKVTEMQVFWQHLVSNNNGLLARSVAAQQLRQQLDHVTAAAIPDREALAIWQETLSEAVDAGLSAEAGFELLCERMDAWYAE